MIEKCEFKNLKYVLVKPDGFDENKKYPTILLLHGAGSRGDDLDLLLENYYFSESVGKEFVSFVPQCHANTWFDIFELLQEFARFAYNSKFVDSTRFYGMGPSMGGYGIWQLSMTMPEIFAAIVPICGGGMYWNAGRLCDVPVWAFHGDSDPTVFPEESKKMVDGVNNGGGSAKLTVYENTQHNAWSPTYKNREVFDWLLSNVKTTVQEAEDTEYVDPKIYG